MAFEQLVAEAAMKKKEESKKHKSSKSKGGAETGETSADTSTEKNP